MDSGKAIKPSQRKSITPFTKRYTTGFTFEDKARLRKVLRGILIALIIILLIFIGYFITDVFLKFSELPANAFISTEAPEWISSLSAQG